MVQRTQLFTSRESTPNFIPVDYLSPSATYWAYTAAGNLGGKMADGYDYTILVQGADAAGNVQSIYPVGISSMTIAIDKTAPTAAIVAPPLNGHSYQPTAIGEREHSCTEPRQTQGRCSRN